MTFTVWCSRALVLCVAILAVPAISVLASDFEFVLEGPFPIDPFPVEPFAADFDDDGHVDLAVSRGDGLSLLRGDGEGGFLDAGELQDLSNVSIADFFKDIATPERK